MLVATVMVLTLSTFSVPPAGSAEDSPPFTDLGAAGSHEPAIEALASLGVFEGTECATARLCPSKPLRRSVMAVWLVRVLDEEVTAAGTSGVFSDVDEDQWWAPYVEQLAEIGVTNGCVAEPAQFCPHQVVTRAEMASFLARAFDLPEAGPAGFIDTGRTSHAASIDALAGSGIAAGCSTDPARYCPSTPVTRAQIATFLARALGLVPPAAFVEDVEEFGIRHLVAQYTTHHECCLPRATNIRLFADELNGVIVPPWGRLSLNDHTGKRTVANGYLPGGTWVQGRLADTVGGGISQYATTIYNAIFWGGFRGTSYRPHSVYFTRYPPGIEATLYWPSIDLVFRNDSDSHVLIVNEYTDTSLTVKIYGDNDGRAVAGEWQDGQNRLDVLLEGGPLARVVTGALSDRYNYTEPPQPLYLANPDLPIGSERVIQWEKKGWTARVSRTVQENGADFDEQWTVRYAPQRRLVEAHPCVISNSCPDPAPTEDPPDRPPGESAVPVASSQFPVTSGLRRGASLGPAAEPVGCRQPACRAWWRMRPGRLPAPGR